MDSSIEIVLRGISPSDALERCINDEARKLNQLCDDVMTCRVVAQAVRRPKQQETHMAVGLAVTLPGTEVVVNREHADDIAVAVRDAFKAAGVQIADYARRKGLTKRAARSGPAGTRTK